MVPLGSVATFEKSRPTRATLNLFPAAEVQGATLPAFPPARRLRPWKDHRDEPTRGFGFEWTEIALQEKSLATRLRSHSAVVFVFLLLAAQYELAASARRNPDCSDVLAGGGQYVSPAEWITTSSLDRLHRAHRLGARTPS
jgi:hypothetical protein